MKHQVGVFLQLLVLAVLPVLVYWQIMFGFELIVMPASLLAGVVIFSVGTKLREQ